MFYTSLISTVNKLPPEILAKIFFQVIRRGIHIVEPYPYPWRLALVCRLWRDIAFSTPRLWSSLNVQLDFIQPSQIGALITVWKLCLGRSGDCPLNIVLRTSPETRAFIPALLEPLVDHAGRWETMSFGFPLDILLPSISDPDIRYPRLRYLLLQGRGVLGSGDPPPLQIFQNAPSLSRLELHEFSYLPLMLKFPWSQITDLTARMNPQFGIRHLLDALRNMPNISSLTYIQLVDMSVPLAALPNQVLQLPHLRRLVWKTSTMSKGTPFFDWICAPQLSEIQFTCADDDWDSDTIQRFLHRSKCVVTSVRLNRMSSVVASSFLKLVPDVDILTLEAVGIRKDLALALLFDESQPSWIAPKLKVMVLLDTIPQKEACNIFLDMIHSRLRVPLREEGRGCILELLRIKETFHSDESMRDPFLSSIRWRSSSEEVVSLTRQEGDTIVTDAWNPSGGAARSGYYHKYGIQDDSTNFLGEILDRIHLASLSQAELW